MGSIHGVNNTGKYKRKKKRRIKRSTVILLLLMLGYFAVHYISLEIQQHRLIQQREDLKASIQETKNHQEYLLQQIEHSKTKEHIEQLARKYLGLIYPDEKVFIEKEVGNPE